MTKRYTFEDAQKPSSDAGQHSPVNAVEGHR